jgi:nicotinate phosphoribosyltransferase
MSYAYFKSHSHNKEAVFELFFRKSPFESGFTVSTGLTSAIDFLNQFRFGDDDIAFLAGLLGIDNNPLFSRDFLEYLLNMEFSLDVDAVPEGSVVFPYEPMMRVKGNLIQCQLLETALLNIFNYQTLIATKAARIKHACGDKPLLEFGLRRAHGIDGSLSATRAAYIGGIDATSNVLAAKLFGVPCRGTMAHSFIMSFDTELAAFQAYAQAMPNNCIFLVDTYDTISGVKHAIEVGKWLKEKQHKLYGIRLDSGDLAYLSIEARKLLDEAGLEETIIFASNDLDEHIISSLNSQGAQVGAWISGTKLITAYDQPALNGVYKLTAVKSPGKDWQYKLKLSEQAAKTSLPGIHQVRRFLSAKGEFIADAIFNESDAPQSACTIVDPLDMTRRKIIPAGTKYRDLLVPIYRSGKFVYKIPALIETKEYAQKELSKFHPTIKRFLNPHQYPVGLDLKLHELKTDLTLKQRGLS